MGIRSNVRLLVPLAIYAAACSSSYGESEKPSGSPDAASSHEKCPEPGAKTLADHCYFELAEELTYPLAKEACTTRGAHLATITSNAEQALVLEVGRGDRWIGLESPTPSNDRASYGWVTGEPVSVDFWYLNDPDEMGCVVMSGSFQRWVDRGCNTAYRAVCERD